MNHYKTDKKEICYDWQENLIAFSEEHEFPEEATNNDLWRIYYGAEQNGFENLPENTGLERAYKNWLLSGHMAGQSWGVYRYKKEM